MIGKKNIAFGFLYLVLTAALGPYMIVKMMPERFAALGDKQVTVGRLQSLKTNNFEEELEPLKPEQIAKANTEGVLSLNKLINIDNDRSLAKTAHVHGNLEALLNIAAGLALCFIAVGRLFKQIISWLFIAGAVLHSGMVILLVAGMEWAGKILAVGPFVLLAALLLIGVATLIGFKGEVVRD